MTEAVQIALIVAIGPTLIGLGTLIRGFYSDYQRGKAEVAAAAKVAQVEKTLVESNKETADHIAEVKTTAEVAAKHVVEVKDALVESGKQNVEQLNQIQSTGEATHALANGAITAIMKREAIALRRLADKTADSDDEAAADIAEKALEEHISKAEALK